MKLYLAENIGFLREKNNLSLTDLGARLGMTPDYLQLIENENYFPDAKELLALSMVFNMTVDRLLKHNLAELEKRSAQIKMLVMDVDGVLTDGGMYYTSSGEEIKKFSTKDGRGIMNLRKAGIMTAFLSSGIKNEVARHRAEMLKVDKYYIGLELKIKIFDQWCHELNLKPQEVAFIGDDINDLDVINKAGFTSCPADAVDQVKNQVNVVLRKKGGEGCVREFIDKYLMGE